MDWLPIARIERRAIIAYQPLIPETYCEAYYPDITALPEAKKSLIEQRETSTRISAVPAAWSFAQTRTAKC